jgi:hypothetical protein
MPEAPPHRTAMIVLAYLWPLAIVPLLFDKEDAEAQWHAKHGLVLMGTELLLMVLFTTFTALVSIATFGLGCVFGIFGVFIWVGIIALHIAAILKAVNGGRLNVPYVTGLASRL